MAKNKRQAALEAALAEEPGFHAAAVRLTTPNAVITSEALGRPMTLRADEFGIVRPADPDEVRLADVLRLPVLRSADQEAPAAPEPVAEIEGEDTEPAPENEET